MDEKNAFVRRINEAAARFDSLRIQEQENLQSQVSNLSDMSLHRPVDSSTIVDESVTRK